LTVHQLLEERARATPSHPALVDDQRSLDFSAWWRKSRHLAALLQSNGVRRGDIVGVLTRKTVFLPVSFTSISLVGARFVALNPGWPPSERERVFGRWSERFLLSDGTFDISEWQVERSLEVDPEQLMKGSDDPEELPEVEPDDVIYLNVTSASTGLAKVAATTHSQLLANTIGVCRTMSLASEDVHMSLFGVIGHPHELFMRGLYLGGKTVLTRMRYPREILQAVARERVTCLMGLPPQLDSLARLSARGDVDLSSLRMAEAGGMHTSQEFIDGFQERTGVPLYGVWGSTETSGVVLVGNPGETGFTRVVDGYEVQMRELEEGTETADRGELWVAGEGVVERYLGDRTATEESLREGWYRTGDMFRREDGRLVFLGRRGGLVKSSGLKVYPLELELAILRHPHVADVCVVGAHHPVKGEIAAAYVVPRPGMEITGAEMRRFLKPMVEEHKIPKVFSFVPGLPRTANGKIDRKAIGKKEIEPDYRGELLRTDVELVGLLNHRADLISKLPMGFDPTWVEEQVDNVVGHNPGPLSDSAVREVIRHIISTFEKR
jgi:long-chain acyl-CoA synthetase